MYTTVQDYTERSVSHVIPGDRLPAELLAAERDVDGMTFGRLRQVGLTGLTGYQRDLILQAIVDQADFRYQYAGMLDNPLASYAINGVSMAWDTTKLQQYAGVYTQSGVLSLLHQTGLTYRGVP